MAVFLAVTAVYGKYMLFMSLSFQVHFLEQNVWIPIKISLKFVGKVLVDNILALVQIMAWRRPGDKPLSEPMIFSLPTHICVTRPQWVNEFFIGVVIFKFWCDGMTIRFLSFINHMLLHPYIDDDASEISQRSPCFYHCLFIDYKNK